MCYSISIVVVNLPQNYLLHLKLACSVIDGDFCNSSGSLFLQGLWSHCPGCFRVLNYLKMLSFHGHSDLGEEPEVTLHQN